MTLADGNDAAVTWRTAILDSILRVALWLGVIAAVPSLILAVRAGLYVVVAVDLFVLLTIFVLQRTDRLSYRVRATLFCLCPFAIACVLQVSIGARSQMYFVGSAVLTALLLGRRAGLLASAAGAIAVIVLGLSSWGGRSGAAVGDSYPVLMWIAAGAGVLVMSSVLAMAVGHVVSRLERALVEEISARTEAAEQREFLRAFVDMVPDVVYSKDTGGRFRIFNAAAMELAGVRDAAQMLDKTVFDFYPREIAERLHADDAEVLVGRAVLNREVPTRDANGREQWYLTRKVPHRDASGVITGVIGISRNITDRKQLEEQLRQSQKMEAVGQLAGGVAHDFNNLLTIIVGFSEMLRAEVASLPDLLDPVEAISDAAARAAVLTRQLLAFSRQTMLQPKVIDLNTTISDTSRMLSRLIGERIHFSLVLDPSIPRVRVDPGQFDQVLMNLAVNARDAMPDGGTLTIATQAVNLTGALAARLEAPSGPHVRIEITDTGSGMTPDVVARIFEPFYTTKGLGSGTGLGLAMVFGIVRQSGGSIDVESTPGAGSTFSLYLPAVQEALSEAEALDSSPAVTPLPSLRGTEVLLLVEDDAGVRELARRTLAAQGYEVLTAANGREAMAIAESRAGAIALLITDVAMPVMTGAELVASLHERWPLLRVIYVSGYSGDAMVQHGAVAPEVSFLAKPHTPLRLLHVVRSVLDSRHGTPL